MAASTADRLTALEEENAALRARLAAVEGSKAEPAPPTYRPPEATITRIPPRHLVVPTEAEMRELFRIAGAAHPRLVRQPSRFEPADAPFEEFRAAFLACGLLGRVPQLDGSRSVSWWTDYARYDAGGTPRGSFGADAFTLAALAHGDVAYRAWSPSSTVEFGLTWANAGTPAGDAWRSVIARGRVPDPVAPAREPRDVRGPVELSGVGLR